MNIKFKMPKFWRRLEWSGMAKELVLTFIGTTLSIILTFGTAHYLEQKQLRADGRQTAMMLIHDMEDCAETMEQYVKSEEEEFKLSQYVIEQMDRIDSIAEDTLSGPYFYITKSAPTDLYQYDDSNEKLFLSDQDVWKNINNATFMDIAQYFFYMRRQFYEQLNTRDVFIKPVSYEEMREYCDKNMAKGFNYADYLRERLTRPKVSYFLNGFQVRVRTLNGYATSMRECAKRCKFLMDISDAELKEYLEHRKHGGHPLKKRKLIGTWIAREDMDKADYTEFRADNTLVDTYVYHFPHPYYVGRAEFTYVYTGTWEIKGDSLVMNINPSFECTIDTTQIRILPNKQEEANAMIALWYDRIQQEQEESKNDTIRRGCWAAFMDGSGRQIEAWRIKPETGKEACFYMIKKEDK